MVPVVRDDDCNAILLVTFYESSMIFEGRDILPAVEPEASISNLILPY